MRIKLTATAWRLLVSALLAVGLAVTAGAADDPNVVIEEAVGELASQLDGRREELAEDRGALYAIIDSILLPRFDRRFAAQVVLAKNWRTASDEQRDRFIEAFYQALLRKYADGILEFQPDMVTVLPFRGDLTKRMTTVRTTVKLDDGTDVSVDYELVNKDGDWLVFNVIIEGVSYVRNYRAELDSEIRGSSLDAVIARLEDEAGMTPDG